MVLEKIKPGIPGATASVDEAVKSSLSILKDAAGGKSISRLVNDILALAPLIEAMGFNMKEVNVDASFPPGISLSFDKEKEVDAATVEKLLTENKDRQLLSLIVGGLQNADAMQKNMELTGYYFQGLGMKIGFPPDICLKFVKN